MREFDLCVIGSGPAGQKAAIQAAKLGKSVAVIEQREVVGGVTVNTGTIPSKALREAILRLGGHNHAVPTLADFSQARNAAFTGLQNACQEVIKAEIDLVRSHFASNGIHVITGKARFRDATTIDVEGANASTSIKGKNIVIAVGTAPARPKDVPFDDRTIITSDEIVKLPYLPKTMIVVGGGVIGTEYASMMAQLGVRVTIVEGRPRLLDFIDAEIIESLQYHLRQHDVTLRLGEKVAKIRRVAPEERTPPGSSALAEAVLESGKTLRADCLLYCIGRQGATDGLLLENAGLACDSRGRIPVDDKFQTKVPGVYACGDVIGFPALASTSMEQGRLAACAMFGVPGQTVQTLLPYGIYAIPEISMVGWTEEALTREGIPYEAGIAQYKETARGQLIGDDIGMLKMLVHQESHVVMGVHAIGTGATELIHIGQAAIAFKATVEYFVESVFNYPTLAECYKIAAFNVLNKLRGN